MTIAEHDTTATLDQLASSLSSYLRDNAINDPVMIGIHTGGIWIAEALRERLQQDIPLGTLDISLYRDDFSRIGFNPEVRPSEIPFDIDNQHIILVDDVLYTGRTIRAALNEIFDYGRPISVTLVVLVERDGRQLPIAADLAGMQVQLEQHQQIKLSGSRPIRMEIIESK